MTTDFESFGKCPHYDTTDPAERWVLLHPKSDYSGDCSSVFLSCSLCRIKIIATMTEQFNAYQNGEDVHVLECIHGDKFPSFNQYTAPYHQFEPIPEDDIQ